MRFVFQTRLFCFIFSHSFDSKAASTPLTSPCKEPAVGIALSILDVQWLIYLNANIWINVTPCEAKASLRRNEHHLCFLHGSVLERLLVVVCFQVLVNVFGTSSHSRRGVLRFTESSGRCLPEPAGVLQNITRRKVHSLLKSWDFSPRVTLMHFRFPLPVQCVCNIETRAGNCCFVLSHGLYVQNDNKYVV